MFVLAAAVAAHATASYAEEHGACRDDVEKFCKDVQPGGGRILSCLREHETQLSAACKQRQAERAQFMSEAKSACQADVDKLCAGTTAGGGKMIKCIRKHKDELSPQCTSFWSEHKLKHEQAHVDGDCHADIQQYCASTKPGEGRLTECLMSHESRLAPACKAWIDAQP
jgi:hypothetical protein